MPAALDALPPALPTPAGADINSSTGRKGFLAVCKTASYVEFYDPQKFTLIDEIRRTGKDIASAT